MAAESKAGGNNPLLSESPEVFDDLIRSAGPASLLVVIESRMGRFLRERTSAEDILQDALLCAWRDRRECEWRGAKSFRSWLLSIIDNRLRDAMDYERAGKRGGGTPVVPLSALAAIPPPLAS